MGGGVNSDDDTIAKPGRGGGVRPGIYHLKNKLQRQLNV